MSDPVCGMTVTPETAAGAWEHGGEAYYFCSLNCLELFKKDPENFIGKDPAERRM